MKLSTIHTTIYITKFSFETPVYVFLSRLLTRNELCLLLNITFLNVTLMQFNCTNSFSLHPDFALSAVSGHPPLTKNRTKKDNSNFNKCRSIFLVVNILSRYIPGCKQYGAKKQWQVKISHFNFSPNILISAWFCRWSVEKVLIFFNVWPIRIFSLEQCFVYRSMSLSAIVMQYNF